MDAQGVFAALRAGRMEGRIKPGQKRKKSRVPTRGAVGHGVRSSPVRHTFGGSQPASPLGAPPGPMRSGASVPQQVPQNNLPYGAQAGHSAHGKPKGKVRNPAAMLAFLGARKR